MPSETPRPLMESDMESIYNGQAPVFSPVSSLTLALFGGVFSVLALFSHDLNCVQAGASEYTVQ